MATLIRGIHVNNLKIGTRLALGFSCVVFLIIGFAIFSYIELRTVEEQTLELAKANSAAFEIIQSGAREVPDSLKKQAESSRTKAIAAYDSAISGLIFGCALSLAIAILFAVLISRSIVRPLQRIIGVVRDIAEGERDLTKNIHLDSKDELGELSKWFDMFMDNIQEDITNIGKSTHQIAAAASQLHATAGQISAGAQEVAQESEQVATAGEELSSSSAQIAGRCSAAAEGSRQASEAAHSGKPCRTFWNRSTKSRHRSIKSRRQPRNKRPPRTKSVKICTASTAS